VLQTHTVFFLILLKVHGLPNHMRLNPSVNTLPYLLYTAPSTWSLIMRLKTATLNTLGTVAL